ncbi:ankyrin repeat domain-containing protein [Chryseobacterium sp.]|uniref:ankyrin repeat domain-containing protein n=1 Tax=Chryseobacterium sp. TaxID=1871047 RepID=UPI0028976334|nr:ankyrin repeat domain-containing protein [Chryseobacterium sp.]
MNINFNNLFIFIEKKQNDIVKSFLNENGIDKKDEFGRTPLMNASFSNNTELISWLLENGAEVNAKDNKGYTALHFAAQEAHDDSVNILLNNNAEINAQDENGNTPTWVCIMHWKGGKNMNNLRLFYQKNADLDVKNNAGRSAKDIIPEKIFIDLKS